MTLSRNLEETKELAKKFLEDLRPSVDTATVVGLRGELGSGKTAFAQAVAEALGVAKNVTSPTFVLEKIYKIQKGPFTHLIHIDGYRLENSGELPALGWDEIITKPKNLILVEWPERLGSAFPAGARIVRFRFIDEETREITT